MIKPMSRGTLHAIFMVLTLLGVSLPVTAVTVDGLYSIEVPVEGSAPAQLQAGYAEGLNRVFLRISGSSDVLDRAEVQGLLQDAEKLLQAYQFLRADGEGGDRLRMTFGAVGVNKALASVDAPVWGANRPLTLAWIAVQDSRGRQLVSSPVENSTSADNEWQRAFSEAAARRGTPIALPPASMGADRQLQSEVWGQFMGSIRDASSELNHDLLAVVRVGRDGTGWRASWLIEGRGIDDVESSVRGASPTEVAHRVVDAWADMLGSKYAVAAGSVGDSAQVDIVIEGVNTLADYAAMNASLASLTPVLRAGAVKVNSDKATIRVAFSGELNQLQEYMALDPRFEQVNAPRVVAAKPARPDVAEVESVSAEEEEVAGNEFGYQATAFDANDVKSFESLYPVLHYRWRSGSKLKQSATE